MRLVDTHAHLDELAFDPDVADVVARARDAGVVAILTIGVTAETSRRAVALAERFPEVYAVVGIQPNYVSQMQSDDWDEIVALAEHPRVVGIGETGLDRYWDYAPIDQQVEWFDRHLELSRSIGKPFVVHCREAEAEVVAQLRRAARQGPLQGVMHSFCGSPQTLAACLELGLMISFAGMVTYKKNDDLRAVAAKTPIDRLLVETDSPYLSPVPHRGKRNEPVNVQHTAKCLADCRGVAIDELAEQTTRNAARTFRLPLPPVVAEER